MNKKNITKYALKKSTEHLFYETQMFYQTLIFLTQQRPQLEVNILLDSFAIHSRSLIYFFYPKKNIRPNDILVSDFINKSNILNKSSKFNLGKTKKKDLKFIIKKVDKQVAHLTYNRNRYSIKNKLWPFYEIGKKMNKTLTSFFEILPESYKNWFYFKEIKKIIDSLEIFLNT